MATESRTPRLLVPAPTDAAGAAAGTAAISELLEQRAQHGGLSDVLRDRLITFISPVVLLLVWEALSRSGVLDVRFFPAPSSIASVARNLIGNGVLLRHTTATLERVGVGMLLGCTAGVVVGLLMGIVKMFRTAMLPILAVTMPIPKIALLPLLMLVLGLGDRSKIAVVAIGVFFIMAYNTMAGVTSIPRIYLEVGRSFGAGRLNFYRTVALPGALPLMLTGFKLSFAVGLLIIVPAEWSGVKQGLGYMIYQSWNTFAIPSMYVGLIAIGVLGFVGGLLMEELERILVPWRL